MTTASAQSTMRLADGQAEPGVLIGPSRRSASTTETGEPAAARGAAGGAKCGVVRARRMIDWPQREGGVGEPRGVLAAGANNAPLRLPRRITKNLSSCSSWPDEAAATPPATT